MLGVNYVYRYFHVINGYNLTLGDMLSWYYLIILVVQVDY